MSKGRLLLHLAVLMTTIFIRTPLAAADGIIVIGDSWAHPLGHQLWNVLQEEGHKDVSMLLTPFWGGPRNLDSPEGREAIESWLEDAPNANYIYMMMGQNNWLCCWTTDIIGSQREADLFASIITHMDNVVEFIWSIRPTMQIVWTTGEYFRPHHLGTPEQVNRSHDKLAELAIAFAETKGPKLTFLDWNGTLQVLFGFDGVQHTPFDPAVAIPPGDPSLPDIRLPSPHETFRNAAHPNESGNRALAEVVYQEYFASRLGANGFTINAGLNDAWFNPATNGQGFFIIVFKDIPLVFLAWFTYDTERPPEDISAVLGDPGHRWITAQGPFAGDTAELDLVVTRGGIFNSGEPEPENEIDGSMTVTFESCAAGTVAYDIPSLGLEGAVPIQRIANDNAALCEALAGDDGGG